MSGGATNGGAEIDRSDPLARGIWIQTTLAGTGCVALVDGSEGREEEVHQGMLDELQVRRSVRVDLRRKCLMPAIMYPWPRRVGDQIVGFEPRPQFLPSSCMHENTLDLLHDFVTHAVLETITFVSEMDPADQDMTSTSIRNAEASAAEAMKRTDAPAIVSLPWLSTGTWVLTVLDGASCLACVEQSDGRLKAKETEHEMLGHLSENKGACVDLKNKYLIKEALFPSPQMTAVGQPTGKLLPANVPARALRHENVIDLVHPFVSHATLREFTFLHELHHDDVARLSAKVEDAEETAVALRMERLGLETPKPSATTTPQSRQSPRRP